MWVQSIAISVYMSVCLSACLSAHISKTIYPNFTKFSVCYLWPWFGPFDGTAMCYLRPVLLLTVDVMFSHNGATAPESKTTRVSYSSPGGVTGRSLLSVIASCCCGCSYSLRALIASGRLMNFIHLYVQQPILT